MVGLQHDLEGLAIGLQTGVVGVPTGGLHAWEGWPRSPGQSSGARLVILYYHAPPHLTGLAHAVPSAFFLHFHLINAHSPFRYWPNRYSSGKSLPSFPQLRQISVITVFRAKGTCLELTVLSVKI